MERFSIIATGGGGLFRDVQLTSGKFGPRVETIGFQDAPEVQEEDNQASSDGESGTGTGIGTDNVRRVGLEARNNDQGSNHNGGKDDSFDFEEEDADIAEEIPRQEVKSSTNKDLLNIE